MEGMLEIMDASCRCRKKREPSQNGNKSFGFTLLGSGSKGNSCVIHGPSGKFLLDAGFSSKELKRRLMEKDIAPEEIRAIVVTHEHTDHVHGCRVFADAFGIPIYTTPATCMAMECKNLNAQKKILISPGQKFQLCGVTVEPFSVSHDVADALAYVFRYGEKKFGYATDLGFVSLLVQTKLYGCDALVLESNYDLSMLKNSSRPLQNKRRIMSRIGHLSNRDCMELLPKIITEKSKKIILAHLSEECNEKTLVQQMAMDCLSQIHRDDISLQIASQTSPLDTYWVD